MKLSKINWKKGCYFWILLPTFWCVKPLAKRMSFIDNFLACEVFQNKLEKKGCYFWILLPTFWCVKPLAKRIMFIDSFLACEAFRKTSEYMTLHAFASRNKAFQCTNFTKLGSYDIFGGLLFGGVLHGSANYPNLRLRQAVQSGGPLWLAYQEFVAKAREILGISNSVPWIEFIKMSDLIVCIGHQFQAASTLWKASNTRAFLGFE